jgi:hypothetical protein
MCSAFYFFVRKKNESGTCIVRNGSLVLQKSTKNENKKIRTQSRALQQSKDHEHPDVN